MSDWTRIALVLGLGASAGLWWLFWHVGIHDRVVNAGDNWFENWAEPALALIIYSVILLTLWESFWQALGRRARPRKPRSSG